ncbi:MAG: ATP-binding cassette domain-containing protein [Candidatus Lindowbacteria bacterium]|nr:ATP-binding cassette domain-containing protein [Candidatus Lindowbacteria bacterium]
MNSPPSKPSLVTWSLVKYFKKRKVVDSVSLEVSSGEIVGLLGPNGAGKTTTFNMVIGLISPDEGEVILNGEKITRLPMYRRARMGIGYLPQDSSVFRKLSVEDNLLAILEHSGCPRKERRQRAQSLLEEFGIAHLAKLEFWLASLSKWPFRCPARQGRGRLSLITVAKWFSQCGATHSSRKAQGA